MEGQTALPFVAEFLKDKDDDVSDEAALALGASRLPEAFPMLEKAWDDRPSPVFLRAMSVSRLAEALDFLLQLIREGRPRDAEEALHALELQKASEEIVKRVEQAVAVRGDAKLHGIFRQRFQRE
jgi:HEAT repeat protein